MPNPNEVAGLDYSLARPAPAAIVAAGFRFVLRYVSTSSNGKNVTAAELAALLAAGLEVGLVWETTADRALAGAGGGAADGAEARRQAHAAGYPDSAVLFAAVDWQASAAQIAGPVAAYVEAFGAAAGVAGVYGSYDVVEALVGPVVPYGWQTAAWSAGRLSARAHLYQRVAHYWPTIAGTDENVRCLPLPLAGSSAPAPAPTPPAPAPAPAPPAPPAPAPSSSFRAAYGQTSPAVARLQTFLRTNYPAYAGRLPSTGYFGDQTAAAVHEFARRSGITADRDGRNVGPLIAAALARAGFRG